VWELLTNHWPLVFVVVILLAGLALGRLLLPDHRLPYEKRPSLVTNAERQFFAALSDVAEERWRIFAMVRLADVIRVRSAALRPQAWRNRILAKHLDFVLCDRDTLEAVLAVELDDATHQRADRVERDEFLEAALQSSKLPLLRVPVSGNYNRDSLRKSIDELIEA